MISTDGRRLRTEKSRERVLDAVLELVEENGEMPTAQLIADRSEMSIRSVFRLYEDINELQACAVQRRVATLRGRYVVPPSDALLDQRIDTIVQTWTEVHESITPLRRVIVGLFDRSEPLRDYFALGMTYLGQQVEKTFHSELAAFDDTERSLRFAALDLAMSWESWNRLRTTGELSVADARRVIADSVARTLST